MKGKKGAPKNEERANEIQRLYALGNAVSQIAHQLGCSQSLVSANLPVKDGVKLKTGRKPEQVHNPLWDKKDNKMSPDKIDELFGSQKFDNYVGREWL